MSTIPIQNQHNEKQLLDDWLPIALVVPFEAYAHNPESFQELKDRYAKRSIASTRRRSAGYLRALATRLVENRGYLAQVLSTHLRALLRW